MTEIKDLHRKTEIQKSTISDLKTTIITRLKQLFPDASIKISTADITTNPLEPTGIQVRLNIVLQMVPVDKKEPPTE